MPRSRHSLAWRARRAIESATASRPLIRRTGPAWAFGALGLIGELAFAPIVLAATAVIGLCTYLLLDTPWTKMRQVVCCWSIVPTWELRWPIWTTPTTHL